MLYAVALHVTEKTDTGTRDQILLNFVEASSPEEAVGLSICSDRVSGVIGAVKAKSVPGQTDSAATEL